MTSSYLERPLRTLKEALRDYTAETWRRAPKRDCATGVVAVRFNSDLVKRQRIASDVWHNFEAAHV